MYSPPPSTAAQVRLARACIASHQNGILHAERQIHDLECQIVLLHKKIARMRDDIALKEALISPIRRLPFEVLGEVAVMLAREPSSGVQVLRTLSSVCKAWRKVIFQTPRAWSNITFAYFPPEQLPLLSQERWDLHTLRDLREWFERSRSSPKDVRMFWKDMPDVEVNAVRDLISAHASELRGLSISTESGSLRQFSEQFAPCISNPMPLLQHIDLTSSLGMLGDAALLALDTLAPRLHSVAAPQLPTYMPRALRARITNLALDNVELHRMVNSMRFSDGFPALQELNIAWLTKLWEVVDNEDPVHTDLRQLYIQFGERLPSSLFCVIRAPNLTKLALANYGEDFSMLDNLLTLSNPPLRELSLERFLKSDENLLKILCRLPLLERLVLMDERTTDKLCAALSSPRPKRLDWICPRLTHLCIYPSSPQMCQKAVEDLAEARLQSEQVNTLVEVCLDSANLRRDGSAWTWDCHGVKHAMFVYSYAREAWWQVLHHVV